MEILNNNAIFSRRSLISFSRQVSPLDRFFRNLPAPPPAVSHHLVSPSSSRQQYLAATLRLLQETPFPTAPRSRTRLHRLVLRRREPLRTLQAELFRYHYFLQSNRAPFRRTSTTVSTTVQVKTRPRP